MNTTKIALSTLAYVVVNTIFGIVYHTAIFKSTYEGFKIYNNAENPNIPIIVIGSILEGWVLSYLFARFAPVENRTKFGITLGVLLILFGSSYGIFQTAGTNIVQGAGIATFIMLELIAMLIYGIIGGVLAALIIRK